MKKILIAAGGSGGHLIPAQVVARELQTLKASCLFGGAALSTSPYFKKEEFPFFDLPALPPSLRRFFPFFATSTTSVIKGLKLLKKEKPDLIVGFGSFHVFPLLVAATLIRCPYVLYEANAVPGRITRLFYHTAQKTFCFFEEAAKALGKKTKVVSHPLRASLKSPPSKEEALRFFGFSATKPTLLVLGGSQGARFFNEMIPMVLSHLLPHERPNVIHLTGKEEWLESLSKKYEALGIDFSLKVFLESMEYAYAASDLVVGRSGASTIAEVEAFQKRAIYVPFAHSQDNHQMKNGSIAAARGGGVVLDEREVRPSSLAEMMRTLFIMPRERVEKKCREEIFSHILQECEKVRTLV